MAEKQWRLIQVRGAAEGVLKGVDLELPLEGLSCFTGRNGSGSRAMAVEVLGEESRRRYMLALSPGEREGMGGMGRVEVEGITGLPPAAHFDLRVNRFRGTVGAFLQVDGLLGQMLQRAGEIRCPECRERCWSFTPESAASRAIEAMAGKTCLVLAPLSLDREGAAQGVIQELRRAGFLRVRWGGEIHRLDQEWPAEQLADLAELEVVVDRLVPEPRNLTRLLEGVRNARAIARGRSALEEVATGERLLINQQLTCSGCGNSFEDLSPDDFLEGGRAGHPLLLQVTLGGHNLADFQGMSLAEAGKWLEEIPDEEGLAAAMGRRLGEACRLGVGYLPLGRRMAQVSSGEGQRLLLAHCLGSGLAGVLYIFEGLSGGYQPDEGALWIGALRRLIEQGNTVLVLGHVPHLLAVADQVWRFAAGQVQLVLGAEEGMGGAPEKSRPRRGFRERGLFLSGKGVGNLRPFELLLPLGRLVCVTGPSGAGKSLFLHQVVAPLARGKGGREWRVEYRGHPGIHRVVEIEDQGKGGNQILLDELGLGDYLSRLYAETPAAQRRGYPADWFRLDRPGGRCPGCEGRGFLHFDMEFMEDIALTCPACEGRRLRPEVLEVTLRGMSMGDLLQMDIDQGSQHFARDRSVSNRLEAAQRCGLGSCLLGNQVADLEGGQRLRLRLAGELGRAGERDLFVLDLPVWGEDPLDVAPLVTGLQELVDRGGSALVADPHPALREAADFIVEIGPGGGPEGGVVRGYPVS